VTMETSLTIKDASMIALERLTGGIVQAEIPITLRFALNNVETITLPRMNNVRMEIQ